MRVKVKNTWIVTAGIAMFAAALIVCSSLEVESPLLLSLPLGLT